MKIDPYSPTWNFVLQWVREQREEAIDMLIADRKSDFQRGALVMLERLEQLASDDNNDEVRS